MLVFLSAVGAPDFLCGVHRGLLALWLGWRSGRRGCVARRSRRLSGVAFRYGASARTVVRAGSGLGSVLGAGEPGDDGSVGRTAGPAGWARFRWDAGSALPGAWRWTPGAVVLRFAGAWGFGLAVVLWASGCTVPEGGVLALSVGVAACACMRGAFRWRVLPGPLSAGQVCHGVGGAPGGPVSPLSGCLPAGDRL